MQIHPFGQLLVLERRSRWHNVWMPYLLGLFIFNCHTQNCSVDPFYSPGRSALLILGGDGRSRGCWVPWPQERGMKGREGNYTIPYLAKSLSSMSPNASHGQTTVKSVRKRRKEELACKLQPTTETFTWSSPLFSENYTTLSSQTFG